MELEPPAPSTNSMWLTIAFSSRITPHSVQTEFPAAPCDSIFFDPQLGQARSSSSAIAARSIVVLFYLLYVGCDAGKESGYR
mmetsp:Transcript_9515/g.28365  ORF Transcript_9515/g.28365 Transcript_9515/m.28365 type:complete len:82 (+) Transcript_9515:213-458(+)